MDNKGLVSYANISIHAPVMKVWDALVRPAAIKRYMFGAEVVSDWKEGSPITWRGEYLGKKYEDKGVILKAEPGQTLQYTHFSPLGGTADLPENYHTVTIRLQESPAGTELSLAQDNNSSASAQEHASANWQGMLQALKKFIES